MTNFPLDAQDSNADLAEAALHARVMQRCQRSYAHELRNSLQGIYTGFDVLTRMLDGKTSARLPPDKAGAVVRKSIVNHEHSLEEIRKHLTLQNDEPESVRIDEMLNAVASFLNNDASSREIQLDARSEALTVWARPSKVRLALLSLLTEGIDAMTDGGDLAMTAASDTHRIVVEFVMTRRKQPWPEQPAWQAGGESRDWTLQTLSRMALRDDGTLETSSAGLMRRVRLRYRVATAPER